MECQDKTRIKGMLYVEQKYNYPKKFIKALQEGNMKYVDSLFKRGKARYE